MTRLRPGSGGQACYPLPLAGEGEAAAADRGEGNPAQTGPLRLSHKKISVYMEVRRAIGEEAVRLFGDTHPHGPKAARWDADCRDEALRSLSKAST